MEDAAFITQIVVVGSMATYTFDVTRDEKTGELIASCGFGEQGGPCTSGRDWNHLAEMLPDCVTTWEDR